MMKFFTRKPALQLILITVFSIITLTSNAQTVATNCSDNASAQITVGNCTSNQDFGDGTVNNPTVSTCGGTATEDGWLWFTATTTKSYVAFNNNSTRDGAIYIYSGNCNGTYVTCANANGSSGSENVTFTTVVGTKYRIRIARTSGTSNNLNGSVCVYDVPQLTSYTPANACEASSVTIVITGTGFTGATAVKIGSTNATSFTVNSSTQITANFNAALSGAISVTGPGGTGTHGTNFATIAAPALFTVIGGGAYCSGGSGVVVGLNGSATGINYQLLLNGVDEGSPIAGTGSAISFGTQSSAGTYTISATNTTSGCTRVMTGNAVIAVNPVPSISSTVLPTSICEGSSATISAISSGGTTGTGSITGNNTTSLTIPDTVPAGISSSINITQSGSLTAATNLSLTLTGFSHTYVGDLIVTLTSPCGTTIVFDRPGVPASSSGNSNNLSGNYTFSTSGANGLSETGSVSAGTYKPTNTTGATHSFTGISFPCNVIGTWTLTIVDAGAADLGTLSGGWSLTFANSKAYTTTVTGNATVGDITYSGTFNANASVPVTPPAGTNIYNVITTDANGCTATSQVSVDVIQQPSTAEAGTDQILCSNTATLNATTPLVGTGEWSIATGSGGSITNTAQNNSAFTGVAGNSYSLVWTVSNGSCSPSTDTVTIILVAAPDVANAGADQNICGTTISLSGNVPLIGAGQWTIIDGNGGSFTDANSATSAFNGIAGNIYTLVWTISNEPCASTSDTVLISFESPAVVDAGINTSICSGNTVTLNGSVSGSSSTGTWSTSGDGIFDNNSAFNAIYTPGATDIGNGSVSLILSSTLNNSCNTVTDTILITINQSPTVDAGTDQENCSGSAVTINASITGFVTTAEWTTSGDGTFDNANLTNTIYYPGSNDISNGSVTLYINISSACGNATDSLVINIYPEANVNAGPLQNICEGSTVTLSNASFNGGATSIEWSTSGDGTFDDATNVNATYTPGANDIQTGSVTLTITTNDPTGPCDASFDYTEITISPAAGVNAGADQSSCEDDAVSLHAILSGSASTLTWSTAGDGTFSDVNDPDATYQFGLNDISNGSVVLTATTDDPAGLCGAASDEITLTVNRLPGGVTQWNGPLAVCKGVTGVAFSVDEIAGVTTYNWSGSTGVHITSGNGSRFVTIDFDSVPFSGYYIYVETVNSCGTENSKIWIRNDISTPQLTAPTLSVCNGANVTYYLKDIQGADSIQWIVPANATLIYSDADSAIVNYGSGFTNGSLTINAYFYCGSKTRSYTISTVITRVPTAISGIINGVCSSTQTYSIAPVSGASNYLWTVPSGATINGAANGTSVSVTFTSAFTQGNISVQAANSCGVFGGARSVLVRGIAVPPSEITGPATVCAFQTNVTYTAIAPSYGATSYSWTVPAGASIVTGQGSTSITVNFGAGAGNVNCRAVNSCGTSSAKSKLVTKNCRTEDLNSEMMIYPNPAKDILYISSPEFSKIENVSLIDMLGKTVLQYHPDGNENTVEFNVSNLHSGVYFVRIINNGSEKITKVVIE